MEIRADSGRLAEVFWDYKDLAIFVSLFIPASAIAFLVMAVIFKLIPFETPKIVKALPLQFLAYAFWFKGLQLILRQYERPFADAVGWRKPPMPALTYVGYGFGLTAAVMALLMALQPPNIETPMQQYFEGPFSTALIGVFAVTLGPLCEELAFRGFMQPLFTKTFGIAVAILLTSLPFALLHGPEYAWSWRHIVGLVAASVGFGYVRHISGSTQASTLVHSIYNFIVFTVFIFQQNQEKGL